MQVHLQLLPVTTDLDPVGTQTQTRSNRKYRYRKEGAAQSLRCNDCVVRYYYYCTSDRPNIAINPFRAIATDYYTYTRRPLGTFTVLTTADLLLLSEL